jgi:hypothetical protein
MDKEKHREEHLADILKTFENISVLFLQVGFQGIHTLPLILRAASLYLRPLA